MIKTPTLSLYIHLPWCVQKCPYCDFNSHAIKNNHFPEDLYVQALLDEIDTQLEFIQNRSIASIFFGGGTPSIFSGKSIEIILEYIQTKIGLTTTTEITMEANPGTIDSNSFADFIKAGVNRLSIGIQTFQKDKLKLLGRIHDQHQALKAIEIAKKSGCANFNLDLMHGLPNQTTRDAILDLELAISCAPNHISWYQLTIEPNTLFAHTKPKLPSDDILQEIQLTGESLLTENKFINYEVSAWCIKGKQCIHNLNYWQFGDYLGFGAGAHSKLTNKKNILRRAQIKHPTLYLNKQKRDQTKWQIISAKDTIFEFMLNALRLSEGVNTSLFTQRTGQPINKILPIINQAKNKKLLKNQSDIICATDLGRRFLNDLTELFL